MPTGAGNNGDVAVVRLTSTGVLDTTFDSDGMFLYGGINFQDVGRAITLDAAGNILVAGTVTSSDYDAILMRLDPTDGSLDTSFDSDGFITLANTGTEGVDDLAETSGGKILLSGKQGRGTGTDANVAVWRFNSTGSLDTSFGNSGVQLLKVPSDNPVDATQYWGGIVLDGSDQANIAAFSDNGTNRNMTP